MDSVKTLASTLIRDEQVWGEDGKYRAISSCRNGRDRSWIAPLFLIDLRYGFRIFLDVIRAAGPSQVTQEGTGVAIENWSLGR